MSALVSRPSVGRWLIAVLAATIGVWWQFFSLPLIEKYVNVFPAVHDVLLESLPLVNFGIFGEILFFGLIALFAVDHFRIDWRRTPDVLIALGIFYFIRGWFLFFFPIGSPYGAIDPALRLNIWGHATHAFFPGGHIGVLTVLAMMLPTTRLRPVMWIGIIVFGIGSLLAKNHYTMDSVAGIMLGAGVAVWVRNVLVRRLP